MKITHKRIFSLFLTLALLCGAMVLPASAASTDAKTAAGSLYQLGLFKGTGTLNDGTPDFALDKSATRAEAAVMLVRLVGAEQEAKNTRYSSPFTDTADWSKDYIGYVYATKITKGISDTEFGSDRLITAAEFLTLVLRTLGYSNVDYRDPYPTARTVGLTYSNSGSFLRGDMAVICNSALSCRVYGATQTLRQQLEAKGVIKTPAQGGSIDLQRFYEAVKTKYESDVFNANMAVEGDFLTNYYGGLSDISLKQRVIYMPMMSVVVCEIALVEVENASDVQKVKDVFQARIDAQVGTDDNPGLAYYPMSIEGWTNNSRIVSNGNFVMLIVWENCDKVVADFNALF